MSIQFKVMVADREPVIADTLASIFSRVGYLVRAANDSSSAIALTESWRPDLAILDHLLPDLNGIATARRILSLAPNCRIILLSTTMPEHLVVEARSLNCEVYPKPVPPVFLLKAVEKLLTPPA